MSTFAYRATRADGERISGAVEAASVSDASALLLAQGLFPVAITRALAPQVTIGHRRRAELGRDLQGLASLLGAGLPLQRALAVAGTTSEAARRDFWQGLEDRVAQGVPLSSALRQSGAAPELVAGLIRAGEHRGQLADALRTAAETLERDRALRGFVAGALAYPGIVALVGIVSVAVILLLVVPRFTSLLDDQLAALPASSRLLFAAAAVVGRHGSLSLLLAALVVVAAAAVLRREGSRHAIGQLLLTAPVVGPIGWSLSGARVAAAVGALLESGVGALQALDAGAQVSGNRAMALRLSRARDAVNQGQRLARALADHHVLPPRAAQLALFGEEAGTLGSTLREAGTIEETEARARIAALVRLLEPTLIVSFGAVVAFVAAALLQAVYAIRPGS